MAEEIKYTDTKEKIWKALKEAKELLAKANANSVDFAAEAKAKKNAQVVEKAGGISAGSIGVKIANLQKEVQTHFAHISTALNEKVGDLTSLEEAIAIKQLELKDLVGIEAEALDLASVVTAKQQLAAELDAEYAEKLSLASAELEEVKIQISEAKKTWNAELTEARKNLLAEQKKLKDEFEYEFGRHKRNQHDLLSDDLKVARKKHDDLVSDAVKALDEREDAVSKREEAVISKEEHYAELEERILNFPAELQEAVKEAKEAGRKDAERTAAIKSTYMEKDHVNEVSALKKQIELLETALNTERESHKNTHDKLETANQRVQDIAINAVKSAAESKVVVQSPYSNNGMTQK